MFQPVGHEFLMCAILVFPSPASPTPQCIPPVSQEDRHQGVSSSGVHTPFAPHYFAEPCVRLSVTPTRALRNVLRTTGAGVFRGFTATACSFTVGVTGNASFSPPTPRSSVNAPKPFVVDPFSPTPQLGPNNLPPAGVASTSCFRRVLCVAPFENQLSWAVLWPPLYIPLDRPAEGLVVGRFYWWTSTSSCTFSPAWLGPNVGGVDFPC